MDLHSLLRDDDYREALAEQAYMRERSEEAAVERETEISDNVSYWVLAWSSLSDGARRPYRTAVAETCDHLLSVVAA